MRTLCALFLLAILAVPARAQAGSPSSCAYRDRDCVRHASGLEPAALYASSGRDLVRLMGWSGFGPLRVILEFRKTANGTREILLIDANDASRRWIQPLAVSDWHAAVAHYRWSAKHPPPSRPAMIAGIQTVCVSTDAPFYHAEFALKGQTEYTDSGDAESTDGCTDPMDTLSETLMNIAADALPACRLLSLDYVALQLGECARLGGNRRVAAEIANRARPFDNYFCERGGQSVDVTLLFAPNVRMAVGSAPPVTGSADATKALVALVCSGPDVLGMGLLSVDANGNSGVVRGFVRRGRDVVGPDDRKIYFHRDAPVVQHWAKAPDGQWCIVDWTIGPFGDEVKEEHNN
jgi:hypothetical protein